MGEAPPPQMVAGTWYRFVRIYLFLQVTPPPPHNEGRLVRPKPPDFQHKQVKKNIWLSFYLGELFNRKLIAWLWKFDQIQVSNFSRLEQTTRVATPASCAFHACFAVFSFLQQQHPVAKMSDRIGEPEEVRAISLISERSKVLFWVVKH